MGDAIDWEERGLGFDYLTEYLTRYLRQRSYPEGKFLGDPPRRLDTQVGRDLLTEVGRLDRL